MKKLLLGGLVAFFATMFFRQDVWHETTLVDFVVFFLGFIIAANMFSYAVQEPPVRDKKSLKYGNDYVVLGYYRIQSAMMLAFFAKGKDSPDIIFMVHEKKYGKKPFLVALRWGERKIPHFLFKGQDGDTIYGLD